MHHTNVRAHTQLERTPTYEQTGPRVAYDSFMTRESGQRLSEPTRPILRESDIGRGPTSGHTLDGSGYVRAFGEK